jgi:hypothetical protein
MCLLNRLTCFLRVHEWHNDVDAASVKSTRSRGPADCSCGWGLEAAADICAMASAEAEQREDGGEEEEEEEEDRR